MKMQFRSHKVELLTLSTITIMAGIYIAINYLYPTTDDNSTALTYSSSTDVSFTFAPTLSIGVSASALPTDNIVPGTSSDSDSITASVSSNTPYGYVLSAIVGSNDESSQYYDTSDLILENNHDYYSNSASTSRFKSIDPNANLPELVEDNTWGYTISIDGGNTWSNYNGLSNNSNKILLDVATSATPSQIEFKIAAKASTTQASGTYNNVITFYAVGKPKPLMIDDLTYMQDFNELTETDRESIFNSMPVGRQYKLTDSRDNNTYWLAKQADGNVWMTQNLDLCIGCDGTATLTSQNTDLNTSGSGAYIEGYSNIGDIIVWSPSPTATTSSAVTKETSGAKWEMDYDHPYSSKGGGYLAYTSNSESDDILYNSPTECISDNHTPDDCEHYYVGSYYNWSAAIASNDSSGISREYEVADNSICPAGWKLPSEFGALLYTSGISSSDQATLIEMNKNPLYFVRGGIIDRAGSPGVDYNLLRSGFYWSSTNGIRLSSYKHAYFLYFSRTELYPASSSNGGVFNRACGMSIHCVTR